MTAVPRPSYKGTTSPASRRGGRSHDSPFSPRLTRETLPSPISPLLQIRRNRLSLHRLSPYPPLRMGFRRGEIDYGEMAEWSIAAVLKTVELRGSGGSNPSLSAVSVVTNEVTALFFYGYTTLPKSPSPAIRLRSLYQISQTSAGSAYPHEGVSRETESPTATKPLA